MIIAFIHTLLGELEKSSVHFFLSLLNYKYNIEEIGRLVKHAAAKAVEKNFVCIGYKQQNKKSVKNAFGMACRTFFFLFILRASRGANKVV